MEDGMTSRYVRVRFRLNDDAITVPASGPLTIGYSVDPWRKPAPGRVFFVDDGVEYFIPEEDIARFEVIGGDG
jgi:hypothetical protein